MRTLLLSNPEFIFMFALPLIDDIEELAERRDCGSL
jgi:hypothetical protein